MKQFVYGILCVSLLSFSPARKRPYSCGPVLDQKEIEKSFQPVIDFIELKENDVFADVGASSGYYTVMMSTLLSHVSFYIEDIDTACLNSSELNKVIDYYSKQSGKKLREIHAFHLTVGSTNKTLLPENTFDKIYTNAAFHQFANPDSIVQDLYQKLKKEGTLTIRDSFTDKEETQYCSYKKCGKPLVRTEDFLKIMAGNNFVRKKTAVLKGVTAYLFTKNRFPN